MRRTRLLRIEMCWRWKNSFLPSSVSIGQQPECSPYHFFCYSLVSWLVSENFHAHHRSYPLLQVDAYLSSYLHFVCLSMPLLSGHPSFQSLCHPASFSVCSRIPKLPFWFAMSVPHQFIVLSKCIITEVSRWEKIIHEEFMPQIFNSCVSSVSWMCGCRRSSHTFHVSS